MLEQEITIRARHFAEWAHGDQKYGDQPYVAHLDDVVGILREYGRTDDDFVVAGYLHDVLEDSKIARYDDLGAFSETVRQAMLFCTDAEGKNRKERKAATYARCHHQIMLWLEHDMNPKDFPDPMAWIPLAVTVKVADRLANIRNCIATGNHGLLDMYRKERQTFLNAMFVRGVCDKMWVEYDRLFREA